MAATTDRDRLVALRRDLHRHPEPAWCEFYTTARVVEEVRRIGVDELRVGREVLEPDARMGVPEEATLREWRERAREAGAPEELLDVTAGGYTGAMAVLRRGEGPTVALRVDIDALPREESEGGDHAPAAEGFASETPAMHACGHDAHATIGLGVLEAVSDSDSGFEGTLKVVFQPAEEQIGGGKAVAESGHLDDVDYLLALHVGLGHPTGEVVAGIGGMLAVAHFRAEFTGESTHAGGYPERGNNAVQAMATAVQNLYAIPRHSGGATRVNAGRVGGGTASNIVPEEAFVDGEVRGETTELKDYVQERADDVLRSAAEMYGCSVDVVREGEAPAAESDQALVDRLADAAAAVDGVESVLDRDDLGGSEDASYLMRRVQERGGLASYVCVGTDHPGGHHTATFDVDEDSLDIGVSWLTDAVLELGRGE
ncbi:MAG: amidohydrolase [Halobacteriaceae archaeon]